MLSRMKHNRVLPSIICISLLMQIVWTSIAAAFDWSAYSAGSNDALRNGLQLAFAGRGDEIPVTVTLPPEAKTVNNVYKYAVVTGVDSMYGRATANRIDTSAVERMVIAARTDSTGAAYQDTMILWKNRFEHRYFGYDFDSLIANPRDTVIFPHVLVDTSFIDSAIMATGDTTRIESIVNLMNIRLSNVIEANDSNDVDDSLAWVFWDRNADQTIDSGDSLINPSDWFHVAPGESMHLLVKAAIPIVYRDSAMDTLSLICRTDPARSHRGRSLTKVIKDVITIELVQAVDAISWIDPDTVVAGTEADYTYSFQLILGNADEFRFHNPFASFTDTTGNDYDTMWVNDIAFGRNDTFLLRQSQERPGNGTVPRDSAAWYYDRATDTLYVKFQLSSVQHTDTLRIGFGQHTPSIVSWDTDSMTYDKYDYPAIFDDNIDPTPADTADTIMGVPVLVVRPDSATVFDLVATSYDPTIRNAVTCSIYVRDVYGNRVLTYINPYNTVSLEASNVTSGLVSSNVRLSIGGTEMDTIPVDTVFDNGLYTGFTLISDWADSVRLTVRDSVYGIYGVIDSLIWVDRIAPLVSVSATHDTNGNGVLDRIVLHFDSPVHYLSDTGFTVAGYTKEGYQTVNDTLLYIFLAEEDGRYSTGDEPLVSYDAVEGRIQDQAQFPNRMIDTSLYALDSAAAVICSALYYDYATQSIIDDTLKLFFSEAVNDSLLGSMAAHELALYDGSFDFSTIRMDMTDDSMAAVYFDGAAEPLDVEKDSVALLADSLADLKGIATHAVNQKVLVEDRTAPVVAWVSPADSILAQEVPRLHVICKVTEWQSISADSVLLMWDVPYGASGSKTSAAAQARLSLNVRMSGAVGAGESLYYDAVIDLSDPQYMQSGMSLAGDDEVVFSVLAVDDAGNRTFVDSIAVLPVRSAPRWYHCSRGPEDGYTGGGWHDGVGPYDAWAFVPKNAIIFDSVAVTHFYNGEVRDEMLREVIDNANIRAQANEHVTVLDPSSFLKVHEYAIIDKFGNRRRYDTQSADKYLTVEIFYDDLDIDDVSKLTLFKLDDYRVVEQMNGSLDTVQGSHEWLPIQVENMRVVEESSKVVCEVDLDYLLEDEHDETRVRGLGVFTIMGYTPPTGLLSSVINYPNPFDVTERPTEISYVLKADATVEITITNLIGDLVWQRNFTAGSAGAKGEDIGYMNQVEWDGRNANGRLVANGGYICKIKAVSANGDVSVVTRKIGVMK